MGEADPAAQSAGVPIESVILPAGAALAALGAIRLVPVGVVLAPAFVLAGGLVGLTLVTELRIARASGPPSSTDRTAIQVEILVVAFLGFAGVAALVPGGLPQPGDVAGGVNPAPLAWVAQAGGDALIAFLLAYRSAALRSSSFRDVAWFAITGAAVVAIAAVALRSIEIPGSSDRRCSCSCSSCGTRSTAAAGRRAGAAIRAGCGRRRCWRWSRSR